MAVCGIASFLDLLKRALEHFLSDLVPLFHTLTVKIFREVKAMAMRLCERHSGSDCGRCRERLVL